MSAAADKRWTHVHFISAGAGSGKTYRLTEELGKALVEGGVSPAGVIGTTFTVKAAGELRERVRARLLESGRVNLAERTAESLIGTVHSVCERLLKRFAFELGLSPQLNAMSVEDGERFFRQALDEALDARRRHEMNGASRRLNMLDKGQLTWQKTVKDIADKARENDIGADALRAMGERNADALLAFFAEPAAADVADELRRRVSETIAEMPVDGRRGTEKYRQMLREILPQLERDDCLWQVWMKLAGEPAIKAIAERVAYVQDAAARYEAHPALHRDLRGFAHGVFAIAANALARFEAIKRDRGLIDFADMERLALRALDEKPVRERLAAELELLLVDEFQDTNPMQMALFLKLAALADRALLVGDVKQAIYGFRGCDPSLVHEALDGLVAGGATLDQLKKNYRSRPALVRYVNELFAAAFAADDMAPEAVALKPQREEFDAPAVAAWCLSDKNAGERALAVAAGIVALVDDEEQVADPETKDIRPMRYGDIAVLARTNDAALGIAEALRKLRAPVKMTVRGLLEAPEVALARSCLRRLAERADTLASAEIMALADCAEPEEWLTDRLDWLANGGGDLVWGEGDDDAAAGHPIIRRLREMQDESALRSPVETVARVLNEADIRRIAAAWGPDEIRAAQRQKNLDTFLNLAVAYEEHAEMHHEPGTLAGFLLWLENPSSPELDLQPVVTAGDAVHVLTYHRAKDLEWPVVVCTGFEHTERFDIWDARVELVDDFDIDAPLANRDLRYWPNIFGIRKKGVAARTAIEKSEAGLRSRLRGLAEQRRLAYVGMTRARDRLVLVLALPMKKPSADAWMHSFLKGFAIPDGESLTLPSGATIPADARTLEAVDDERPPLPYRPRWFERRERIAHPRKFLQPSAAPPAPDARIGRILEIGDRIRLRGEDMADVGNGLHAVIAAELVNPLPVERAVARASELLDAHGVADCLDAGDAVAVAHRFRRCLGDRFKISRIEAEVPVSHAFHDGRVVRGFVDAVAETVDGYLIVDHKSSPQRKSTWRAEARRHSGQLRMYRDALTAAGCAVAGCYVHFALTGALVEVGFPASASRHPQ